MNKKGVSESSELKDLFTNHISSYNPNNFENTYNPVYNNYQTGKLGASQNIQNYMSNTFNKNLNDKDLTNYNNNYNNINENAYNHDQLNDGYHDQNMNNYDAKNQDYCYDEDNINCDIEVDEVTPIELENNQVDDLYCPQENNFQNGDSKELGQN